MALVAQYDCPGRGLTWGSIHLFFASYFVVSCNSPAGLGLRLDGSLLEEMLLESSVTL